MSVAAFACAISQALSAQQSARVLKSVCERVQTCASMSFPKRAVRCSSRRAADCEPEHSQQGSVMPMWAVWTVRAISQCASVSEHDNCGARIITFKQMRSLAAPREQRVCWSGFRRTLRPCSNRMQQARALSSKHGHLERAARSLSLSIRYLASSISAAFLWLYSVLWLYLGDKEGNI